MKRFIFRKGWPVLLLALAAALGTVSVAMAGATGAQWGMYQHDPQHTAKNPAIGPTRPEVKWRLNHPSGYFDSSFTAGTAIGNDGTVYGAGQDGRAYAINPDGSVKFTFDNVGVCCVPPAIGADGTIYFSGNRLYALNPDFSLKWIYHDGGACCGALIVGPDGTIYVANGRLHAIDPVSGSVRWMLNGASPMDHPEGNGPAPALSPDGLTLYHFSGSMYGSAPGTLMAINPVDGRVRWTRQFFNAALTSPVVAADGAVLIPCRSGAIHVLNPDGNTRFTVFLPEGRQATALLLDESPLRPPTIICKAFRFNPDPATGMAMWEPDGKLYAIDYYSARIRWEQPVSGGMMSPVTSDSQPIVDAQGTVYLPTVLYAPPPYPTPYGNHEIGAQLRAVSFSGLTIFEAFIPATHVSDARLLSMDDSGTIYMLADGAIMAFGAADSVPPVISGLENQTIEAASSLGGVASFAVTATDLVDPAPSLSCYPASGSVFPLGTTSVSCYATDAGHNYAWGSFTVSVRDTTAPAVIAPADVTLAASGILTPVAIGRATATDAVGVTLLTNDAPAAYPLGTTIVTWTAMDAAGNATTAQQRVTVRDQTPPVITITGINAGGSYFLGAVPTPAFTAIDPLSGIEAQGAALSGGNLLGAGTYTYTVTARDKAGNDTTSSVTYAVVYGFGGFRSPLSIGKAFKFGSTVPVKFRLADASGVAVAAARATLSLQKITDNAIDGEAIVAAASGNANAGNLFRFDPLEGEYVFNLDTKGLSAGSWQLSVRLDDQTVKTVLMTLK